MSDAVPSVLFVLAFDKIIIACACLAETITLLLLSLDSVSACLEFNFFCHLQNTSTRFWQEPGDDSNYHTICMTFMFIFALFLLLLGPVFVLVLFGPQTSAAQVDFDFDSCLTHSVGRIFAGWIRISLACYGPPTATADRGLGLPTAEPLPRFLPYCADQTHSEAIKPDWHRKQSQSPRTEPMGQFKVFTKA